MHPSLRYYALSLGLTTGRLYEGYRDTLIDIEDARFPFDAWTAHDSDATLISFLLYTDQRFGHYVRQDALCVVLVGSAHYLSQFEQVTTHLDAVIGRLGGNYLTLTTPELGRLVWPIVQTALQGTSSGDIRELTNPSNATTVTRGLGPVGKAVQSGAVFDLFVDEDYHVWLDGPSTLTVLSDSPTDAEGDPMHDAVDLVIEKVLSNGGNVIFLDSAAMLQFQRIALITTVN